MSEKPFVFIREHCCKILIITAVASVLVSRFPSSETQEKEKHLSYLPSGQCLFYFIFVFNLIYFILIKLYYIFLLFSLRFIFFNLFLYFIFLQDSEEREFLCRLLYALLYFS